MASPEPASSHHPQVHATVLAEFPESPSQWGDEAGFRVPSPRVTAAGGGLTVSASESSVHPPEAGGGRQCAEPISTGSPVRVGCPSIHTPAPTAAQGSPLSHHLYSTPRCEPHPAHSPLVLQCRRRAHSVHVTSLAGEDPTKLDPDISVHPTGHGKRSDVQLY